MRNRAESRARRVKCVACKKPFLTRHSQGKYCSARCKREADRASWRLYGERNKEKRRIYQHDLYQEQRDTVLARTTAYAKTEAGKLASRRTAEKQKVKHPERIFARQALGAAIRAGYIMPLPCARCGEKKVHGHHDDYSDPFTIIWLCQKHHSELHAAKKTGKVGFVIEDGELAHDQK